MAKPIDITDSTYDQEVLKSTKPVLVDFWAEWCGPCRTVGPILAEIADEEQDRLKIVKVNVDENTQYAAQLGVMSIPTMVLYKNGEVVDKIVGALPKRSLVSRIDEHLGE